MDAFIEKLKINQYLTDCGSGLYVKDWSSMSLGDIIGYPNTKCLKQFVEAGPDIQVIAVMDGSKAVSLLSFKFIETQDENDEPDNMVYIKFTCTEDKYAGRGLSKLLHYIVILYAMANQMQAATALVVDATEASIFKAFGGIPVSQQEIQDNDIISHYGVTFNYIIPFDNTTILPKELGIITEQVRRCKRPLRV